MRRGAEIFRTELDRTQQIGKYKQNRFFVRAGAEANGKFGSDQKSFTLALQPSIN